MISSRYSNEEEEEDDDMNNDENITRSIMNQIFNEILCQDDPVHVQSHDNTMEVRKKLIYFPHFVLDSILIFFLSNILDNTNGSN